MPAPLTDSVIVAMSRLVDDAQVETREPSHSDIEFQISRCGLSAGDPKNLGQVVGKAKRVRSTLSWSLEHNQPAGQKLIEALIAHVRACGGFREGSPNYVGQQAISNLAEVLRTEGYLLTPDGELRPRLLDQLSGDELTVALQAYVRRAVRGAEDAALVTGTGKDLLEATAAHILVERYGAYSHGDNFPTLVGQAFSALTLLTPQHPIQPGEQPQRRLQRALFEVACAVNTLRNKQGTGHGRPWQSSVTSSEAKVATELMGSIAEYLLAVHKSAP